MIEQVTVAAAPPDQPGAFGRTTQGWPGRLLPLLLALSLAGLGAALGGRLAWPTTSPTSDAAALDAARAALPGVPTQVTDRSATAFRWDPPLLDSADAALVPVLGGDGYRYGTVTLAAGPVSDPAAVFETARQNLTAAGWTVDAVEDDQYQRRLAAHTDTLILSLEITTTVGDDGLLAGRYDPNLAVSVGPPPPTGLGAPMLAGALAGALLGALLGLLLARRLTGFPAWIASAALLVATPLAVAEMVVLARYLLGAEPAVFTFDLLAPWHPYSSMYLRAPALLGALVLLAVVIRSARGSSPSAPTR
ncbi:hypothetical protein OHA21_26230 [Actinoplanes sp. NBC_00393]|uniref:hypothetical protein n=1 Tax=Actinoplanes sp. NBC_00393 TaxID=2975953 RepID=UPI002E2393FB